MQHSDYFRNPSILLEALQILSQYKFRLHLRRAIYELFGGVSSTDQHHILFSLPSNSSTPAPGSSIDNNNNNTNNNNNNNISNNNNTNNNNNNNHPNSTNNNIDSTGDFDVGQEHQRSDESKNRKYSI